jgi:hypothetical protein
VPEHRSDGGGVKFGGGEVNRSIPAPQQLVEPGGVHLRAQKFRLVQDAAEQRDVRLDAGNGVLLERAAQAGDGFFPAVAPGD